MLIEQYELFFLHRNSDNENKSTPPEGRPRPPLAPSSKGKTNDPVVKLKLPESWISKAMLTNPIDEDATRFYTRFGFIASPLREQQLLLLLKDARRWVC